MYQTWDCASVVLFERESPTVTASSEHVRTEHVVRFVARFRSHEHAARQDIGTGRHRMFVYGEMIFKLGRSHVMPPALFTIRESRFRSLPGCPITLRGAPPPRDRKVSGLDARTAMPHVPQLVAKPVMHRIQTRLT